MQRNGSLLLATGAILTLSLSGLVNGAGSIKNTKHNMSASGTGTFIADTQATTGTDEICVFCHTPHMNVTKNDSLPLWNHKMSTSTATYTMYKSSTFNQGALTLDAPDSVDDVDNVGNVMSVTNLCLSCHDGTQAINAMMNPPNRLGASNPTMQSATDELTGNAMLGTDLTNDHPVNFTYQASIDNGDGGLNAVTGDTVGAVRLFDGTVQCASCHNPHTDYSAAGDVGMTPFLRVSIVGSTLCLTCHDK